MNMDTPSEQEIRAPLVRQFEWLLENSFVTSDFFLASMRSERAIVSVDQNLALHDYLSTSTAAVSVPETLHARVHRSILERIAEFDAVVTGRPVELQALLLERIGWPEPTETAKKRGITDLSVHVFDLNRVEPELSSLIEETWARDRTLDMDHLLLIEADGVMTVAAKRSSEAMIHYQNIVMSVRAFTFSLEVSAARAHR